jgi:hypothetical protein
MMPEELRAAAEVHSELGPGYSDAVLESFLDKVGREIDARVDARLSQSYQTQSYQTQSYQAPQTQSYQAPRPPAPPPQQHARDNTFRLAVVSIALGIPITAIVTTAGSHPTGIWGLLVVWMAIAAINVASALHNRPRNDR